MSLSATDYLLWAASAVLLVLTGGLLLKRRFVCELPVFFAYVAFQVVQTAGLFAIHVLQLQHRMSYSDYFYAYWTSEAVGIALGLAVIYEVYCKVFRNYDALRQFGGIVFGGAAVVLLVVAVVTAATAPGTDTPGIVKAVLLLERSVRVMQCGLLAFLFVVSFFFGLPWRSRLFGIAFGFGVFATVELAAVAVRSQIGTVAATAYSRVGTAAYGCGVLIWACYLLAPIKQYASVISHNDLEKWNQALLGMLEQR